MRAFIILSTLALYAHAGHLGYNYQQPSTQGSQGGYKASEYGSVQSHGSSIGDYGGSIGGGAVSHGSSIGSYGGSISGGAVSHGSAAELNSYNHGSVGVSKPEYQKEFFTFSAPEHEFVDDHNTEEITSTLKKNLRVVFIKGPENSGLEKAALQLAKSSADQQTAIYVLSKQADLSELAQKLQNANTQSHSKPEVHFVKYRTPEDAEHAKHAIQAQYESLPGSTNSHDGGVAPVHNYASNHPAPPSEPIAASNAYLPAALRL